MAIDIKKDEQLRRAREQLRQVNLDLKLETQDHELVVVAVERTASGTEPLPNVPPLRYPTRTSDLAQWVGDVTARVTRS